LSLSFITKFTNLVELVLWFDCEADFTEYFDDSFQYTTFPQLQILKLCDAYPEHETFFKFLENNGRNLKELHMDYSNSVNSFNLNFGKLKIKDKNIIMEIVEKYKKMGIIKNFNYNGFYC